MNFDLSPDEFFYTLVHTFTRFRRAKAKERTDLFYLIMGLNHLREWIAPGYRYSSDTPAKTENEIFYNNVYDACEEWRIVNELCNSAKHTGIANTTSVQYGLYISDWPSFSGVVNVSKGPPSGFFYGTRNMVEIFEAVILFYQAHWFQSPDVVSLLNNQP